jgi:ABC-type nickel/cobalt efflux system permease component RcnA
MLLAAAFGAAHALTPGHGKTLVAAYLVGERGTPWHAVLLGVVTTLTHTAAVLVVAAVLPLLFGDAPPAAVQAAFGLVGGLLIAGLGLWLLMARLTGRADHVHLGGGHHHHHHHHDPAPAQRAVGWWGLVVLGMSGGIVPCWDAIAMLGLAISAQRLWLGLPLLLAFSAGLAGVLIVIGLGVVYARNLAGRQLDRWQPLVRALPIASALVVTVLGLWLCYDSVQMGAN